MNTLFGTIFKSFHCFLPLMNRYCLQFLLHLLLDLQNIFVLVTFHFHFQFRECVIVWRIHIRRVHKMAKHRNFFFTTLLLGHSRSAHLFGMSFRYRWRYLCFLPTLSPSAVWWGLEVCHLGSCNISSKNLRGWWSFCRGRDAHICNVVGEWVVIHQLFKRIGGEGWIYNWDGVLSPYKKTFANRLQVTSNNNYPRIICRIGGGGLES